ncbi:uncharacterized protein [Palaemon carinicauda]|uniref:uncharacterized protein n=1 Tax=Palaemon carinicauda TaxID=392227 RepID=UPI0035B60A63
MKGIAFVCLATMAAAVSAAVVPGAPPPAPAMPGAGAAVNPMSPGFGASFAGPFAMYMMPPAGIPGVPGGVPGVVGGLSLSQISAGGIPGVVGGPLVAPSMPPAVADLVKKKVALGVGAAAPPS